MEACDVNSDARWLAEQFEVNRGHLRAVAYGMLGSVGEADDAVQEAWLRLERSDLSGVANPVGWLTTVVGRISLDMLRARRSRREEPLGPHVPDPILSREDGVDPEYEALLADSVGLAMLVVLETLSPAERLAFVLHDMFGLPFDEIAPIVDRTPTAARKLASRARRRVRGAPAEPAADLARQREVVDAFQAAARDGDFEALSYAGLAPYCRPALVNGAPGIVAVREGRLISVLGFTVVEDRIVEIDILADPQRLRNVDLAGLEG